MKNMTFRLISFTLLVALLFGLNSSSIPAWADFRFSANSEQYPNPDEQNPGCIPGSGWRWTEGPTLPEVASQAQEALRKIGIEALVSAQSYGEIDSCGTYQPFGIDFQVIILESQPYPTSSQKALAEKTADIFTKLGQPHLGNVSYTFPDQQILVIHNNEPPGVATVWVSLLIGSAISRTALAVDLTRRKTIGGAT